ncbi:DUF221-domain-containing protein [Metschnikowia bicuspidata var. bicuspidata NRRL YB-4993]|uniref:DUF221-domain-containing protein n=1 Tax=Metschnikowia bicuspidata var. bicuspidata NRRL YB-4993 TaxID=869754 RepID=A0A1A0HA24_9ASCO|nr:DUF221-domain-containing protein [Metschnikowia bicuspidata var. bicuspidata NRRL YB-4993]OBA20866.1 DUF221-domain-containing protein [Metschnikowia bicuspidata var. bicuspidata NRRL YB-4993]
MSAQGTSTLAVLSSLATNAIIFGCFVGGFFVLRLKFKRIYSPKSSYDLVPEEKKPEPLPKDPVRWIYILLRKSHSFIIQQCGLDGYFFLRYLYIMGLIFLFGILTWGVLLPVNATSGAGKTGLDQLSISNISQPKRYYAHALMSWVFYGSVIYVIYRELFFFNSFRAAVLSSPRYAFKRSSRTVLFQSVPDQMLDDEQFYKLFNGVKQIFVSKKTRKLSAKVQEREDLAYKLERATTQLLQKAVKAKAKAEKKNIQVDDPADINTWVPRERRPRERSKWFSFKKVDVIETTREKLKAVDVEVQQLQENYKSFPPKNSIFVEFEDQYTAQLAYQTVVHHNPMRMSPRYTGMEPDDINWLNMRLFWWERIVRRALAIAAIVALIIFWAIPVAFVGIISNINNLTDTLPFLSFINNLPDWLLGIVTGLLPTVLLALLLVVLPFIIRIFAKIAGTISVQETEHFTHTAYFAFLTINGFLVTALASSATSTVEQIINNPTSALSILAENLPRSSNFYLSYLILQGLTVTSGALFQVVGLFVYYVLGTLLDSTLRKKWTRFSRLRKVKWGTQFPPMINLASITMVYAVISPMILLFSCVAFGLMYIASCHNLSYVMAESADSRGSHYPKALFQTFTGIYMGQVCLLGLFVVGKGWGPIVLQIIGLFTTVFVHIHLKIAFDRLMTVVPIDCMKPLDGVSHTSSYTQDSDFKFKVLDKKSIKRADLASETGDAGGTQEDSDQTVSKGENLVPLLADCDSKKVKRNNFLIRYFRPDVFMNYRHVKKLIPATYNMENLAADDPHAYDQPDISEQMPILWIPKDDMGWSAQEIDSNKDTVDMRDRDSGFTAKGKVVYLGPPPY